MMPEDISEFVNEEQGSYIFYNKDGNITSENVEYSCAYIFTVSDRESYYAKTYRSDLFDPNGIDSAKINSVHSKFSKINKETFDHYINYLMTKENNSLAWAKRGMIDV
tara:strand:+ start:786 stop:1109 length:324 start_codon:yes stop_codon:yes gene_type:complete